MKLEYDPQPKLSGVQIYASLRGKGDKIPFRGILTDKSQTPQVGREERAFDMFYHINGYWSTLTYDKREQIYDLMFKIKMLLDEIYNTEELIQELRGPIKELIALHDFDAVQWYLTTSGGVIVPSTVKDIYEGDTQLPGTRAQTYIRTEYLDLITLSTILRVMYPIFMEFVYKTQRSVGTDMKEYFAYMLLDETELIQHKSMLRLQEYIAGCLGKKSSVDLNRIIHGTGSEEFPRHVLSTVIVKKVCCGDIRGVGDSGSLINVIWQCVSSMLTDRGGSSAAKVTVKRTLNANAGDDGGDSATSRLEGTKLGSELSTADVEMLRIAGDKPVFLAQKVDPTVPEDLVRTFLAHTIKGLQQHAICECQVMLTKWILHRAVSPHGLDLMYKPETLNCMAAAQAVLWHKGYTHLAALLGGRNVINEDVIATISGSSGRTRIPTDVIVDLLKVYKFSIPTHLKSEEEKVKWMRSHHVVLALSHVSSGFTKTDWEVNLPPEMVRVCTDNPLDKVLSPSPDLVATIARVVIELVS